jgi:hypothetical protein
MSNSPQASPADVIEFLRVLLDHPPGSSPGSGPTGDLPSRSLDRLRRTGAAADPAVPRKPRVRALGDEIIDVEALRRAIGSADPVSAGSSEAAHEIPGHVEHAKRTYLSALIDELGGDLSMISRFWDRTSTKTIRKLVRRYRLDGQLEAARARGPRRLDRGVDPTRPRPRGTKHESA